MAGRYGPFLTAAPGAPAPPAGFIGDAVTEVPVTGSPLGTNFFRVEGPGLPAGGAQHDTFALMGKVFTGIVPPAPAPAPAPAPTTAPTGGTTAPAAAPAPAPALTSTPSPAPVPAPAPAQVVTAAPIVAPVKTTPVLTVDSLSVSRSVSLRSARAHGLRLTVFTLDGTRVVKIRLLRKGRVVTRTERIVNADGVLTIVLPASAKGRHKLVRGIYTLQITPGAHPGQYGQTTTKTVRIG